MTEPIDLTTGWDDPFLTLSSKLTEPFCWVWENYRFRLLGPLDPQKFNNCDTKTKEIAVRALLVLGAVFGTILTLGAPIPILGGILALGIASKIFRKVGYTFQKGGFSYNRGLAPEKEILDGKVKAKNWNVCGPGGGLSIDHGGVVSWNSEQQDKLRRVDALVEKIKKEDPDVVELEEIYDDALGKAFYEKLKDRYAHFMHRRGPNTMGSVSGGMTITKCAIHRYTQTPFVTNDWSLNRGFSTLEIKASPKDSLPFARFIGTHLIHGEKLEDQEKRKVQVEQIVQSLANEKLELPTVLMGDLNMERDGEEGAYLSKYLHHGYQGKEPTCTNRLVAQWDLERKSVWGETIDYISLFKHILPDGRKLACVDKNITIDDCHLVKAYDETFNTKTALSDHCGVVATIKGLKRIS